MLGSKKSSLAMIAGLMLALSCGVQSERTGGGGSGASTTGGSTGKGGSSSNSCLTIENEYVTLLADAKNCDPTSAIGQCTQLVNSGLACSCGTFVNPANSAAIGELRAATQDYIDMACASGIVCGACLAPVSATCSGDGQCQDSPH